MVEKKKNVFQKKDAGGLSFSCLKQGHSNESFRLRMSVPEALSSH